MPSSSSFSFFFFFNDTATTEIYTLSLHDALPISNHDERHFADADFFDIHRDNAGDHLTFGYGSHRSEEHTSELQSRLHLVCRLLLEKKKKKNHILYLVQIRAYILHSMYQLYTDVR